MVNFYLESRTDRHGDAPIRVSISINGLRLVTSTGYSISPEYWISDKQEVKAKDKKETVTNHKGVTSGAINTRLAAIKQHFADLNCTSVDQIKAELDTVIGRSRSNDRTAADTVLARFDQFVCEESVKKQWKSGTVKAMNVVKSHLKQYGKIVRFEDLTESAITAFVDYHRTTLKQREITVKKQYQYFVWFLDWCTRKGYNTNLEYQQCDFTFTTTDKTVVFLDWEELMKLYSFQIPAAGTVVKLKDRNGKEYEKTVSASCLDRVRDLFCFCCFTSLRYSDMKNLKRSDISDGKLNVTTIKTDDRVTIELNDYSKEILDKYSQFEFPGNLALPVISNQKMNDYLKALAELAGLDAPVKQTYYRNGERVEETQPKYSVLSTHAGRRTFICNALSKGIAADIVMKWTGHSDYAAMKPYIDIVDKAKAEAMQLFNRTSAKK